MPEGIPQSSFTMGEIAPSLYGRIDFDGYYRGLRTCRNFIISKYGGAYNRPGTEYVGEVHDSTKLTRLIPFQFNNQQQYVLELGDLTMRVIANGAVVTTESVYTVTGVTAAVYFGVPSESGGLGPIETPLQLTVVDHPYNDGDSVVVSGVATGINGTWSVHNIDADTISLDGCGVTEYLWSGSGTVMLAGGDTPLVVTTPWPSSALSLLKFTQSADVITVTHPNYETRQIIRLAENDWEIVAFANVNGPFRDINTDEGITVYTDGVTGVVTVKANSPIFTADMVGLPFYIGQSPDDNTNIWEVDKSINISDVIAYGANYYEAMTAGDTGTYPPTHTEGQKRDGNTGVSWKYLHSGFGIVKIISFTSTTEVVCEVVSLLPSTLNGTVGGIVAIDDIEKTGTFLTTVKVITKTAHGYVTGDKVLLSGIVTQPKNKWNGLTTITKVDDTSFTLDDVSAWGIIYISGGTCEKTNSGTPTYRWALPAWGSDQGYPATTSYFQNRQLFAGTNGRPSTINMTRSDGFFDFGVSKPVLDDDAITYKLLSDRVNTIRHLLDLKDLIVFTSGGIFRVTGGKNGVNTVITPSTININTEGANAVSEVAPIKVNNYAIFLQEKGNMVRSLGYSFAEDSYMGQDLTTMSNHLLSSRKIISWAYQETPNSCLWSITDDGILLGLTFFPEQQVTAWHQHNTINGLYESVCRITENNEDVLYFIVNRTLNGQQVRCIERTKPRIFADRADGFFVDCGLTYDGRASDTTATTFSGLDHLEGETVAICADGIAYPEQVVVNGTITISNPALVCHIGLPIEADLETLDASSLRQNIRDKKKIINAVSLIVDQSLGFEAGPDEDNLTEFKSRSTENYDEPDNLISELISENIPCDWSKNGRVLIRQRKPLPCHILAVIPQIEVGGW